MMRFVAARALGPLGMLLSVHLGKLRRAARNRPVARQAKRRGRELDGLDLGILGVRRRRAVAGLAGKRGVMAAFLEVGDLAVAVQARGFAGEGRSARPIVAERAGAVVAVDA